MSLSFFFIEFTNYNITRLTSAQRAGIYQVPLISQKQSHSVHYPHFHQELHLVHHNYDSSTMLSILLDIDIQALGAVRAS